MEPSIIYSLPFALLMIAGGLVVGWLTWKASAKEK